MYYNCVTTTENNMSKQELLCQIQSLAFAINDLSLYLDTHPTDRKALALHNEYANNYKNYLNEYERKYGPLSILTPVTEWKWDNSFPWEGGMN